MTNSLGPVASALVLGAPVAAAVAISFWPTREQLRRRRIRRSYRRARRAARKA
ncbi:hypothetical protein [Streptomyces sp. NRRL B-24484]|uniref:hypothetical protein n=1 Tax=Streptomyces sp. NRRL B-24484 TaxID=1463833 RepID=UPI000ABD33E6|nr:hypothetical protein [Streptomyces sp. NRRL B-24484]